MESVAQPLGLNDIAIKEYMRITGLAYIANTQGNHISDILKSDPYIANIQVTKENERNVELIKIFKSKKECIVGYKPEIVVFKNIDKEEDIKVYRLLSDGMYVDNSTFKSNFEGKYTIKKVDIDYIREISSEIPFSIFPEAKMILRKGLEIRNYIKEIYERGLEKLEE